MVAVAFYMSMLNIKIIHNRKKQKTIYYFNYYQKVL